MGEEYPAFSPKTVEQQIADYALSSANEAGQSAQTLEHKLVRDLQRYHASVDHQAALQRIWLRFLAQQQAAEPRSTQLALSQARIIHLARWKKYRRVQALVRALTQEKPALYLGVAAITMAAALTLGRLIYVLLRRTPILDSA